MAKEILKIMNSLVNFAVMLALLLAGSYSAYALWDNNQVYAAAENVQADMLQLRPEITSTQGNGASFEELRKINPDVCAWVTLDNTKIDYPVLQGEDNLSYINTDVYGNFALAGSIFLDSRCGNVFQDTYSLLYGHHMDDSKMFGDLDLYKDEKFFNENTEGMLILPDRAYKLEIFACLLVPASEKAIFEPQQWRADIDGLLDFALAESLHVRRTAVERLRTLKENPQILGMSTCASEFTDARTIILAIMEPYSPEI